MPTVINNPSNENGSGTNLIVGFILVIIVLAAIVMFFMYGLPMIKSNSTPNSNGTNVNVQLPDNVKLPIPEVPSADSTTAK